MKTRFSSALLGALFVGTVGMTGVMAAVGVDQSPVQALRAIFSQEVPAAPEADAAQPGPVQPAAAAQPEALGRQFRSYRLRLAEDGMLPGRLSIIDPASGALVPNPAVRVYFVQNGTTVTSAEPDVGGVFQVTNLVPGVYSMVAAGPGGFMACALEVLPFVPQGQADAGEPAARFVNFQVEATALGIDGAVVPPHNFNALRSVIQDYVPAAEAAAQFIAPDPGLPENEEGFGTQGPMAGMQQHTVVLLPDGTLQGRLRRIHPESGRPVRVRRINVFLMQNDEILGQAPVDESGSFTVPGLQPGIYSLAAAGLEGFAAFSVQAVIPPTNAEQVDGDTSVRPVALANLQPGGLNNLDITTISPEDFGEMLNIFDANIPGGLMGMGGPPMGGPGAPGAGPGGFGGGGGGIGGGGGLFGGGGLGTLLGAAGLGLGAAALAEASDDDDDGGLGSPFDPFFPEAFFGQDPDAFFAQQQQQALQGLPPNLPFQGPPEPDQD